MNPERADRELWSALDDEDWAFCQDRLVEVSRTFSRPIELLPDRLRVATTCGYLLCRIADTVEDHADLTAVQRDSLFGSFLDALDGGRVEPFLDLAESMDGEGPTFVLARRLDRVLDVFGALPERMQQVVRRWVTEMVRGMGLYGHRPTDADGLVVVDTPADLERYCYFVAGTVGHMLTGLFIHAYSIDGERRLTMQEQAESFGVGLQFVNILKDQTDDIARGWCFVPRTLIARAGLQPAELFEPAHRPAAHQAVAPLFTVARQRLDAALRYTLALPPGATGARLFCLLPLWMAARTLVHARGNDAMFEPGEAVKISRPEVERIIADCMQKAGDDEAIAAGYAELWDPA